jgi:hypothetical protein
MGRSPCCLASMPARRSAQTSGGQTSNELENWYLRRSVCQRLVTWEEQEDGRRTD